MFVQTPIRRRSQRLFIIFLCLQTIACSGWRNNSVTGRQPDPVLEHRSASSMLSTATAETAFSETTSETTRSKTTRAPQSLAQQWIVDAAQAKRLLNQGATLLDARESGLTMKPLQGAIAVRWEQFSATEAITRGRLLSDDEQLTQQLQALGISTNKPVVVFGHSPGGWGEEGRIVWMLRTLGHSQTVMVDGGFQALLDANVPLQQGKHQSPRAGNFVVNRNNVWAIQRDDLRRKLGSDNLMIIDARQPREFAGRTPYGERRGGHIPGAVNLYFREFRGKDGRLLARQEILAKLRDAGITPEMQLVVYCTAGVRSGWLTSVLVDLGFQTKNYAGSMWEWSAAPQEHYPLETSD